jgi:hypothetical protein
VGDRVFLKVSPMKGVLQFGKRGSLALNLLDHSRLLKEWRGWPIGLPYPQIWSERMTFSTCLC